MFAHFVADLPARVAYFAATIGRARGADPTGADLTPAAVSAWMFETIDASAKAAAWRADAPHWSALVGDAAMWLGEAIRCAAPQLRWALFVANKKATGYQRPVLTGFTKVDARDYYVDVGHLVASWADLVGRRRAAKPDFLATIVALTVADA